jgi:hypothetical protein
VICPIDRQWKVNFNQEHLAAEVARTMKLHLNHQRFFDLSVRLFPEKLKEDHSTMLS